MGRRLLWFSVMVFCGSAKGQLLHFDREQMVKSTPANPYARFEDGRPKVPDVLLDKLRDSSLAEVWTVLDRYGYRNQYEGSWQASNPERKLVGRAVTVQYLPVRPDVFKVIEGRNEGMYAPRVESERKVGHGTSYRRMIDLLQTGDVLVIDLLGGVEAGGAIGDNMAAAINAATGTGLVVDGAIRDLEGVLEVPLSAYFRAPHPASISNVMLSGVNIPIRIGKAVVMPGDVVLGTREGVYFIPPHLIQEVITGSEIARARDEWTKRKFSTGKYKASDLYPVPLDPELRKEYEDYLKKTIGEVTTNTDAAPRPK